MTPQEASAKLAYATAQAEGYTLPGSIPARANNPGDLKRGDLGLGTIKGKTIYSAPSAGFAALERQWLLILQGESSFYKPSMTIPQVARIWTGNDNPQQWADTVCKLTPISPSDPLSSLLD